jgi:hypothetical protein
MLNMLNKKTSNGPPTWGLRKVLTTPHRNILRCYRIFSKALDLDRYFGMAQAMEKVIYVEKFSIY